MKPAKPSKLEIVLVAADTPHLVCQVCGELRSGQGQIAILRQVTGGREWFICPACLAEGPQAAIRRAAERQEELAWLAKQLKRLDPGQWARTEDLQRQELIEQGLSLGLARLELEALDLPGLRRLLAE
jgi:hypothetical protein